MISVPGIYENGQIKLLEALPKVSTARVIVTLLEQLPTQSGSSAPPARAGWLGALRHTAQIVGDIVQPLDVNAGDWEASTA